jgi:2-keto-4-pentenoate hydratase
MLGIRTKQLLFTAGMALLTSMSANAACPNYNEVLNYVDSYWDRSMLRPFAGITTVAEAYCAQGGVAAEIGRRLGVPAGFRVAVAHGGGSAREPQPIRSFLYENMFLRNGDSIAADFAREPMISAELIAVVKDSALQKSATAQDLLEHIDHFIPFIHLFDASGNNLRKSDAMTLIATNAGTRFGVLGKPIRLEANTETLESLAAMRVVIRNSHGKELSVATGTATLGHPLNALLWLGRDLQYNAQRIHPGDMLGVGEFGMSPTPGAGEKIEVQFYGLPGDPIVSVNFSDPVGKLSNVADQIECFTGKKSCSSAQPQ